MFEVSAAGGGLTDAILSEVAQYLRLLASYGSPHALPAQQAVYSAAAADEDVAPGGAPEAAQSDALPLSVRHEAASDASDHTVSQPAAGTAWLILCLPRR